MRQHKQVITAAVLRRSSRSGSTPVNGEQYLLNWLKAQEEAEKQAVLNKLWHKQ